MYTKEQMKKAWDLQFGNPHTTFNDFLSTLSTLTPEPDKGLVEEIDSFLHDENVDYMDWQLSNRGIGSRAEQREIAQNLAHRLASRFAPRDGWVSVKERFPDYNRHVICAIRWPSGKTVTMPLYRMADECDSWEWLTADDNSKLVFDVNVIHWLDWQIPPPPEVK